MNYGIEIRAQNGAPYVVSDASPFTFYKVVTVPLKYITSYYYGGELLLPDIPTDCVVYPFFTYKTDNVLLGAQVCTIQDGVWKVLVTNLEQCDVEVYLFVDRVLTPSTAQYGVQVYDDEGRLILDNNAKPLKVYLGASDVTYPSRVAVPPSRVTFEKEAGTTWIKKRTGSCARNKTIQQTHYGTLDSYKNDAVVNYNNPFIPYIICDEYL